MTKRVIKEFTAINEVALAASKTGEYTDVEMHDRAFYDVVWSGGVLPVGVLKFEISNDANDSTSWKELDFGASIDITGASGEHQVLIQEITWKYIRPVYTRTSG